MTMDTQAAVPLTNSDRWHAVTASFLGWTLDAFDFFVLVFLMDTLAAQFHVSKGAIVYTITATLIMRPVGAVIFGLLADRYGRRKPLMANVVFFSIIELLCGFAPNYTVFLILRTIYGIGMGGEWGVGASLAMESAPRKWRGVLSGIVQSGYSIGYLLAAVAARFVLPSLGWRAMFWVGGCPRCWLSIFAPRSASRKPGSSIAHPASAPSSKTASGHWKIFSYLVLLMTLMMFLSHGTQDFIPTSSSPPSKSLPLGSPISPSSTTWARCWERLFLAISRRARPAAQHGRRPGAGAGHDPAVGVWRSPWPPWAGSFPDAGGRAGSMGHHSRALERAFARCGARADAGIGLSAGNPFRRRVNNIEYVLSGKFGYAWALATFEVATIALLIAVVLLGSAERKKLHAGRLGERTNRGRQAWASGGNRILPATEA